MERALILFAHGARNASWAAPFERLRDLTAARRPDIAVSLAFLELMTPSLPDETLRLAAQGVREISIVPIFLGQGGHLLRDLPQLLERLRLEHPGIAFKAAAAVGEDSRVQAAMADYCLSALD